MKKAAPATKSRKSNFQPKSKPQPTGCSSQLACGDHEEEEDVEQASSNVPVAVPAQMSECGVCLEPYAISADDEDDKRKGGASRMDVEGDRNNRDGASSTPKLPYLLHCGHSFCEECLASCAEAETSKSTSALRVPSSFVTNTPPSGRSRLFGSLLLPSFSSSPSASSSSSSTSSSIITTSRRPAFSLAPSPPSTTASSSQRVRVSVACPVCRCRTPYDSARGPVGGLPKNYELIAAIRVIRSLVAAAAASPPRRPSPAARGKRKRPTTMTSQRGDDDDDDEGGDEGRWHHPKGEKEEKRNDKKKKKKKTRRLVGGLHSTAAGRSADSTTVVLSGDKDRSPAAAMSIDHATIASSSRGRGDEEVVEAVEEETLPTAPPAHLFDDDDEYSDRMVGDGRDQGPSPVRAAAADAAAEANDATSSSSSSPPPSAPPLPFPSHLFHYISSSSSSSPFHFAPPPSSSSPNSSSSALSATSATSSTSTGCVLFPSPGPPSWAFPTFLSLPLSGPSRPDDGGGSEVVVGHGADARAEASSAGDDARAGAQAAVTRRAGRWVDSSQSCMRCEVAFGLFVRHRRCHYCGGLFCYRCCWQFCEMPVSFGYRRKQRTCSDCAQLLKTPPAPSPAAAASSDSSPAMSTSSNVAADSEALALCSPADGEREEWPSFDLKDKLTTVYDISCKAVDAGVEALALAKGEASTEQSTFVPSDSTMLWGRCMGVMVALPLFVIGTSSVLMAAGGYHAWGFLARQRRKWREEKQVEEDEARITEARLRCGHLPQPPDDQPALN